MLKDKIENRKSGILLYGLTPPKAHTDVAKIAGIAQRQQERLQGLAIDGLVLYDIQDESSRTDVARPFPFSKTLSPEEYSKAYLTSLDVPRVIYQSVGKYSQDRFQQWLEKANGAIDYGVFVGSPSNGQQTNLSLQKAYQLKKQSAASFLLGGVTIPERHQAKKNEHERVLHKIGKGCRFFISQCVYNVESSKQFLEDYASLVTDTNEKAVPVIFTLTPCGSAKTLEFMKWLGIDIPTSLEEDLNNSEDILEQSVAVCKSIAEELLVFAQERQLPIGFNIESVAIRKAEIEASITLLKEVKALQEQYRLVNN